MKNYINLITKENSNHVILFVILNMILVLAETVSIALIPLFIDVIVSPDPILPNYFKFFKDFLNPENKNELLNFGIIFFYYYISSKKFFLSFSHFFIKLH